MFLKVLFVISLDLIFLLKYTHGQFTIPNVGTRATPPPLTVPPFQNCTQFSTSSEYWVKFIVNNTESAYCYLYPSPTSGYAPSWSAAYEMCHRKNATLVSIHDWQTNYILANPLSLRYGFGQGIYWMGLTSLNGQRGIYKWADRTPTQYFNWALTTSNGDPLPAKVTDQGRCVSMRVTPQNYPYKYLFNNIGQWFREDCNTVHSFICQKNTRPPQPIPPLPTGGCPTGWYNANQKCIKYFDTPKTFTDAKTQCQQQKNGVSTGELLTIHSQSEQDFITSLSATLTNNVVPFIGLSQKTPYSAYQWADQSPFTYSNWGVQPSGSLVNYQKLNCATIVTNVTQPGKWLKVNCTDKRPFICEVYQDSSSKSGIDYLAQKCNISGFENFNEYRDSCYKMMNSPSDILPFSDAETHCNGLGKGSHLVSITDPYEQSFIKYYISQKGPNSSFYTGLYSILSDTNDTQLFQWKDNWPVYYSNWMSREPKVPVTPQDQCVTISNTVSSLSGSWKTVDCKTPFPYICKVSSNPVPNTNTGPTNGVCPKLNGNINDKSLDWVNLHKGLQYCYWFSTERQGISGSSGLQSWSDASFHCRRRNGTLATLHSSHETLILTDRLKHNIYFTSTWIGLSRNPEGDLVWEDSSPLSFSNWAEGEIFKNTSNLNEDSVNSCVEMSWDMTWKQVACNGKRNYFVCQTKKLYNSTQPFHSSSSTKVYPTLGIIIATILCLFSTLRKGLYL